MHINKYVQLAFTHYLLIAFANSLEPDQNQQNIGPGLDPNCFIL